MRTARVVSTLLAILAALALAAPASLGLAAEDDQRTLCVDKNRPGCFHSIQEAVDHAPPGSRIDVAAGTYAEGVTITKRLTLRGDDRKAVIDAAGRNQGIFVHGAAASRTVIGGFTVENATLEGILLESTSWVKVEHNLVQHNDQGWRAPAPGAPFATCPGANPFDQDDCGEGLHLNGVDHATVNGNTVEENVGGILLTDEAGATHDNRISRNTVRNNRRDCGITLPSHPAGFGPGGVPLPGNGVFRNVVSDNVSTGNGGAGAGIFAPTPGTAAYDNLVIGNTLTNNGLPGVALHSHVFGQNLNGNRIIGNTIAGNGADDDAGTTGPTGIVIFSDASGGALPIENTTVVGNTISDEAIDVYVGTTPMNLGLHFNNLLGSDAVGVQHVGGGVVDATLNYWGCPNGPAAPACSSVEGAVTYTPWLTHPVPRQADGSED
jgi:parallel beta-helix repeat protein